MLLVSFFVTATSLRDIAFKMISQVLVVSLLAGAGLAVPLNDDSAAQSAIVTGGKVTASIPTTLTEGVEWLVPIQVANKTFNVQLDTGSADL